MYRPSNGVNQRRSKVKTSKSAKTFANYNPGQNIGTKWSNPVKLDRKEKKRKEKFGICFCEFLNCYSQSLSS